MNLDLEQEARKRIGKAMNTIEYLSRRLADTSLEDRKRAFIQEDIDTLEFLIEQSKRSLAEQGIRV